MSSRRPPRSPGGGQRFTLGHTSASDETPAQTNLGMLLQRALKEQAAEPAEPAPAPEETEKEKAPAVGTRLCADCWNAITFKDERGVHLARCAKNLWVKPSFTYEELNTHKIRRWYADCPAYDDSE